MKKGFFRSIVCQDGVKPSVGNRAENFHRKGRYLMNNVQFPENVSGQWIFLERLKESNDTGVLARRKFTLSGEINDDFILLVSANTSYQLFVNGRLAGVGPRTHQNMGTSYIDAHEIGFYLEPGNNLIAFCVHNSPDSESGDFSRIPGLWCQLQCGTKTLLKSDDSWQMMALDEFFLPRSRTAAGGRLGTFTDLRLIPADWNDPESSCDDGWVKPDVLVPPGSEGAWMELHPVPPAVVSAEVLEFKGLRRGYAARRPFCSTCSFSQAAPGRTGAAVSYVFCEDEMFFKVKLYADAPFKLFCNKAEIFNAPSASGEEIELPFTRGFNRLVLFAKTQRNGMGVMFCASQAPEGIVFLTDMLETADPGWCVGSIERLKYEECTSAVRVEFLKDLSIVPVTESDMTDVWDWLKNAEIRPVEEKDPALKEGEMILFQLPRMAYGCVRLGLSAGAGDIVDVIIGTEADENSLFPRCANGGDREVVSAICREGENVISAMVPADCSCILVYLRKSGGTVTLNEVVFDELSRNFNRECTFNCSDPFWNDVWQTGRNAISRSCVALFPADGCRKHDRFLMDSFLESINVAAVFGDTGYIASRLRQLAGGQLENGAIPALSGGAGYEKALFHMFFFPSWMLYNYRFSGNLVELNSMLPKLDGAKRYLVSLLDEERSLIGMEWTGEYEGSEKDPIACCRLPGVLNALFCRFMMSASEIYDLAARPFDARECRRYMRHVSKALAENFFDAEAGLFSDFPLTGADGKAEFSLAGNFFPIFAGVKTHECFENFVKTFFDFDSCSCRTFEGESPYFHYPFAEMLFALGQKDWAFRYMAKYWRSRLDLDKGVWREPVSGDIRTSSFSGGSVFVPNVFLIREIVGVRLAEPAHAVIYFDPAWELVEYADAAIPTALGRIHISWKKEPEGGLEVNIYSSHPLKVMPELSEEMLRKSTFRLSENVTLVKSAAKEEKK